MLFNHNDTGPVAYRHCTKNGAKAQPKCAPSSIISFITKTFSAPRCIVTPLDCQPLDYTKPLRLQILPTKHTTRVRVHKPTSCRRYHILVRTLTTLANVFCFFALLSFCAALRYFAGIRFQDAFCTVVVPRWTIVDGASSSSTVCTTLHP